MTDQDHRDLVLRAIARDLKTAGVSGTSAPTLAELALARVSVGEAIATVVKDLAERHQAPKAEPVTPKPAEAEPLHVRIAREAGKTPTTAKTVNDRVASATAAGNPWSRDSLNVTRQVMVQAADPALAARLRAEAGR